MTSVFQLQSGHRRLISPGEAAWRLRQCVRSAWVRMLHPRLRVGAQFAAEGKLPVVTIRGAFQAGDRFYLRAPTRSIELDVGKQGSLTIGHDVFINDGTRIRALVGVTIGSHCLIGENVTISDSNFHRVDEASTTKLGPVMLEDNVWLGSGCYVLPGVRIGRNSVAAAGSVITKSVPANCLVAGVPASWKRELRVSDRFIRS